MNTLTDLEHMMKYVARDIMSGMRHGFYECSLTCEMMEGKKRRIRFKAGYIQQFVIQPQELDAVQESTTLGIRAFQSELEASKTAATAALLPKPEIANAGGNE